MDASNEKNAMDSCKARKNSSEAKLQMNTPNVPEHRSRNKQTTNLVSTPAVGLMMEEKVEQCLGAKVDFVSPVQSVKRKPALGYRMLSLPQMKASLLVSSIVTSAKKGSALGYRAFLLPREDSALGYRALLFPWLSDSFQFSLWLPGVAPSLVIGCYSSLGYWDIVLGYQIQSRYLVIGFGPWLSGTMETLSYQVSLGY
ncbi:hypothetical protein CRG98_026894 [Punica granatum]|uniref:Uncharacterized protein n=1 Tax=Punica granatum TaxID=22663 RepID=A0A2I0J9P1_PUNGR|nr:hypothetical protein CRG98_026894 [Punica granatum]